jgi:hypothetical protein
MKSNQLPVYCSSSFKWKNNQGSINKSDLIMLKTNQMVSEYDGIFVKSIKSGDVKYFEPVHDEDGYDGEFMIYKNDNIFIQIWNY